MQAKQRSSSYPSPRSRRIGGPFRGRRASHTDVPLIKHALSEASLPRGFRFAATACGLKKTGALDLAVISNEHLRASKGRMRAVVVNAGNANCATGEAGHAAAVRTVAEAAKRLGCTPQELFVCSTGVIGVPLPLDKILRALPVIARFRRPSARSFAETSLAICTTDTRPKTAAASFKMAGKRIHFVGCAKGAGMIHPNMATSLALQIVADGEGAQRVIEIEVRGAKTEAAAKRIAETIATSPLVKTAFAGGDPNWGRIFAAAGRSGVKFDTALVDIKMAGIPVLRRGQPVDFNERAASNKLLSEHVPLVVDLHAGKAMARYWTCDFTAEYVRINASYRT